jgi:hypothetical protein
MGMSTMARDYLKLFLALFLWAAAIVLVLS